MKFFSGPKTAFADLSTISLPDSWSVIEAQYGSHRLVGVLRDGVEPYVGHSAYSHQAGVALRLERPDAEGMPDAQ